MAAFEDPMLRDEDPFESSSSRGFGLRLFKSAEDAYQNDVLKRSEAPQTPDQAAFKALYGGSAGGSAGQAATATPSAASADQAAYQTLFGGGAASEPKKAEQGNFSRGLSVSGKQLKQTAYGTAALIGDTVGADTLKEWGLKGYKEAEKEVQAISKETDSFTTAVEKGELGKWFSYSSGYLLGQVAEMGAASVAGAVVGSLAAPGAGTAAGAVTGAIEKGAVQAGVRGFVGKMIDKQAAEATERMVKAGVAKEIAEKAAVEAATKSVYRTIGATTANTFLNATGELGSIYGEAVEEALAKGEDYSLGRVWLAGLAATAVDSWADSKALGKFVGAFGGDKAIKGVAMEALKGGFREGMTEGVQTVIERWGADKDLASKEAFKEYIDSAAVGVLGGGIAGGTSGAVNKFFKPEDGKAVDTSAGKQDLADQPGDKDLSTTLPEGARAISKRELLDTLGNADAMAYLYSTGDKDQKNAIIKALDRAGTDFRERFDQVIGREDNIRAGEAMLAQDPIFVETLRNSIDTFGNTLNVNQTGRRVARPARQATEAEQLQQIDEANEALYGNLPTTPPANQTEAPAPNPLQIPTLGENLTGRKYLEHLIALDKAAIVDGEVNRNGFAKGAFPDGVPLEDVAEVFRQYKALDRMRINGALNDLTQKQQSYALVLLDRIKGPFIDKILANDAAESSLLALAAQRGKSQAAPAPAPAAPAPAPAAAAPAPAPAPTPTQSWIDKSAEEVSKFANSSGKDGDSKDLLAQAYSSYLLYGAREGKRQLTELSKDQNFAALGETVESLHLKLKNQATKFRKKNPVPGAKTEEAKGELKEAVANLFDVVAETTGAKLNITGQKYTAADLPAAISKVMQALVKLGYVKFKDITAELMRRMRASKDWASLADSVTEQMLRDAYNALPQFPGKEAAAAEPSGPASLRAMLKDLFDAEQRTQETDAYVALELRSSTKEQRADAQKRVDARESAIKRLRSALEGNIAALTDAQKKSELSARLAEIDSMPDDMKSAVLSDVVGELEGKAAPKRAGVRSFADLPEHKAGQRTMVYAGVGSRETPPEMLATMTRVARELAKMGYTLRSGGAKGADSAFEAGADKKEIFYANDATPTTIAIAKEIHPNPAALGEYPLKLMARNTNQVFGRDLNSPVDFVLAWTRDGAETVEQRTRATGGTGQAIAMADMKGVPVINLAKAGWQKRLRDLVDGKTQEAAQPAAQQDDELDINRQVQKVEAEIAAENEKLNKKYGQDKKTWNKAEFKPSDVPGVMSDLDKDIARLEELKDQLKELVEEQRAEAKVAKPRKDDKVEEEDDDTVDYGMYKSEPKKAKPKAEKPPKPQQIAPSKMTPVLREHVASLPQKDQGDMLLRLGQMSEAELKDFEAQIEASKKRKAERKPESAGIKAFREKIDSILKMKDQSSHYRRTLADLRERLEEIDKALRGGRTIFAGDRTFKAVDQTDENAYLWGDQGFRTAKDLPQDKLLAVRRGLVDDIREMQIKSLRGQAALLLRSLSRIEYDLSIARTTALREGLPMEEVDAIFVPARDSIVALMQMSDPRKSNEIAAGAARDMRDLTDADVDKMLKVRKQEASAAQELAAEVVDESDFDVDSAIDTLVADIKAKRVDAAGALAYAGRAMREGLFTFGQLVDGMRRNGVDLPREVISVSGEPAMQQRMVDYVNANGGKAVYREAYLASMDRVLKLNPDLSQNAIRSMFTKAELTALELRNERLQEIRDRRIKDDVMMLSDDAEEAFRGLLFTKYSLSQMRNPDTIPERERMALKETISDLPRAWFQDVYFALKTRPSLGAQVIGEEGMIAPTEVEQYRQWVERHERAIAKEAEVTAKLPYYQQLAGLDRLTNEQYDRLHIRIARAKLDEMDKIMAMARHMNDSVTGSALSAEKLELAISDFQDKLLAAEQSGDNDVELTYDGTMGTEAERSRVADDQRDMGLETREVSESGPALAEEDGDFDAEGSNMLGLDDDGTRLRTATKSFFSGVMTAGQVQSHVARITSKWASAPKITVVQDATMLPEPLRSRVLEKLDPTMDAKGVFDSEAGEVFLFSNAITGEADTEFTLFHEVYGHLGLRAFLGPKFDQFLENMYRVYPGIRKEVDSLVAGGMPKLEAIDEVISDRAAANAPISAFKGWVGRVIAGLREVGLGKVADWMGSITDAELSFYLKGARETAQNGGYPVHSGAPGVIRFRQAQHERLYEMFSIRDGKTTGYARFNPVTQTWAVFKADADDIRNGYTSMVVGEYEQVLEMMRRGGKVEFRKRSGAYVEDKLPGDMPKLTEITNATGMKRWMRNLITQYQNEFKPIFDVVDRLREMGRLTERMDVKTALMLYERKTGAIIDIFRRKYVTPIEKLIKEASDQGADYGTINTFLLARHAKERNEQIARVNPRMPDKGSGMFTEDAENFLAEVATKPYAQTLNEIGRLTDQMSQEKLRYLLNTGMITAKQYQAMQVYKNYVNLSGQNDKLDKFEDISRLVGTKFNVKGKEARAYGRSDPASDILANTILGMESALIRGQKNMVAQKLLAMLEANYDPNFATINEIAYKRQIGEDGMVMEVEDTDYITRKDVMVAKVNGIPVTIRFKDATPGSFAEAIHGSVYPPQSGDVVEAVGKFNQIIGQMLTTWNPAWVAVNFVRDTQTLYFNAASDGRITKAQAAQMVKMLPKAIKTAYYMAMVESGRQTNINPDPEMVRAYNEMKRAGGLTSFLNRKDLENQVVEIEKALGERNKLQKTGDKFKSVLDLMEFMTLPAEIAPRLAAYKVTRDGGFTQDQAAVFSGEITVNFNMRGANKNIRKLFLFFNPAIQGTAKLAKLSRDNPKLVAAYATAWIGLGAAVNLIGRALSDDDEDGRNQIDKVPVYKRATSMVLIPDTPLGAIPIAYGWNAFYALGHFALDTALGIQPPLESAKRIAKTALEAFSPLGTAGLDSNSLAGTVLKGAAPTVLLPVVEFVMNENRFGAPIRMSDQFGAPKPDSEMAFRSVSPISKAIAQGLNEVTGGNRARPGAIDVNPSTIDFLISSYLPGLINEAYKGASVAARVARGEEVKNVPLPLVDRFTAKVPDGYDAGAFRRAKEMIDQRYAEYKAYPELRDQIRQETPGLMRAHAVTASTTQEIRKLRSMLTDFENNPSVSPEEKVRRLNMVREREKMLYNRAVKAVMEAGPEFKDAVMASD